MTTDTNAKAILANLTTTLRGMTIAGGYHWDVKASSVVNDPVVLETVSPTELPFFYVSFAGGDGRRDYQMNRILKERIAFIIVGRMPNANGLADDRKLETYANGVADLEKAIAVDISRGGHAIDTQLAQPDEPLVGIGQQNMVIVVQRLTVLTRRTYGKP